MAIWTKSKPDASHLHSFGCDAYCYILPDSARQKSKPTAVKCKLVGYTQTGYRVWDPLSRRFQESKHVVCVETHGDDTGELIPPPTDEALAKAYDMSRPDSNGWEREAPDAAHCCPDPHDIVEDILQLLLDDAPPLEDVAVVPKPPNPANSVNPPEPGFEDIPPPDEPAGPRQSGRTRQQPGWLRDMVPSDPAERRQRAQANAIKADVKPLDAPTSDPRNVKEALASEHAD
ncbi:hypothetical protein FRC12_002771 [Ceratobasidium sp. 428]|nr:hypothetical protein FRC12_002771 [Ceratobasidium sp. 428]